MPIDSSTYRVGPVQPNGKVFVHETHWDQTGKPESRNQWRPADADHEALLSEHKAELKAVLLPKWEIRGFKKHLERGGLPDAFPRNHVPAADLIRPLLEVFGPMKNASEAMPLAIWIEDKLDPDQVETATDTDTRNKVVRRVARLLTMQPDLAADQLDLVEVR